MRLIDNYRGFVFDLDGTVYLDEELLPGALETITAIRRVDCQVLYMTNKPLERPAGYAALLTRLGLPTSPDEVVSSLDSLVGYLTTRYSGDAVLCVSEPLVEDLLAEAGFEILSPEQATSADVVVVSFDRTFDYRKLHAAYRAVRTGARLVATNPDPFCPTRDGGLPDCAAMLAAIETCTGAKAEAIVGKPSEQMADELLRRLRYPPDQVLLVGDRLQTDVAMARRAGMAAALVGRQPDPVEGLTPDFLLANIGELLIER